MTHEPYPDGPGHKEKLGTSQQAAEEIKDRAATLRTQIMSLFHAIGPAHGMTADECADALLEDKGSIRPRFTELKLQGAIFKTATTRPNRIGKRVRVWRLRSKDFPVAHQP